MPWRGRQLCAVVGYGNTPTRQGPLVLHLACGASDTHLLRYAGAVHVPSASRRFRRLVLQSLKGLHTHDHPAGVTSPLPGDMQCVVPALLVEVGHAGWSLGGMLRAPELLAVHPVRAKDPIAGTKRPPRAGALTPAGGPFPTPSSGG